MLSRILHSTSPTPDAPAESSQTMVTGRVCKNMHALFSKGGSSETLDVKLRLVPVPKAIQNEYQDHMQKVRDANVLAAQSYDGDAWSDFLRSNPGLNVGAPSISTATDPRGVPHSGFSNALSSPHHTSQGGRSPSTHNSPVPWGPSPPSQPQQTSRCGTPSQPTHTGRHASDSRPSSRASAYGPVPHPVRRQSSTTTINDTTNDNFIIEEPSFYQDGPRKRARIEQTDWRGPSSFTSKRDSLRIVASTTASLRNQGPVSVSGHPSAAEIAAGEIGPRPPTPMGSGPVRTSLVRQGFSNRERRTSYRSPYAADSDTLESASAQSPPPQFAREDSVVSTPFDMPSSPPIVPVDDFRSPSSPQLPPLIDHQDSGFMSGGAVDEDCAMNDDDLQPLDENQFQRSIRAAPLSRRKSKRPDLTSDLTFEMPGDPNLLPTNRLPRSIRAPAKETEQSSSKTLRPSPMPSSPKLPPLLPSETSFDPPAQIHAPAPSRPSALPNIQPQSRPRSESIMSMSQEPFSEAPGGEPRSGRGGNGKSRKRKILIENRLQADIEAGVMPKFCMNCGQIKTPSWRKCFIKVQPGVPEGVKLRDEEAEPVCVEPWVRDGDEIVSSRIIKRQVTKEEMDEYEENTLCNPCGIHLFKYSTMRPKEKWDKAKEEPRPKPLAKKRVRKPKLPADSSMMAPDSDAEYAISEFPSGRSDRSVAKSTGRTDSEPNSGRSDKSEPKSISGFRPSNTATLSRTVSAPTGLDTDHQTLLQRAIQSSPPRIPGSRNSPINLEGESERTPDRTRRLLFPSPRQTGEMKTLDAPGSSQDAKATPGKGSKIATDPFATLPGHADKENVPPAEDKDEDDNFDDLFNGTPGSAKAPHTPKSASSRHSDPLKTPVRSSQRKRGILTSAAKRWQVEHLETPSRVMNSAGSGLEDTPFTRDLKRLLSGSNVSPSKNFAFDMGDMNEFGNFNVYDETTAWMTQDMSGLESWTASGAGAGQHGTAMLDVEHAEQ